MINLNWKQTHVFTAITHHVLSELNIDNVYVKQVGGIYSGHSFYLDLQILIFNMYNGIITVSLQQLLFFDHTKVWGFWVLFF